MCTRALILNMNYKMALRVFPHLFPQLFCSTMTTTANPRSQRFFHIEGNIGAGKSTLLAGLEVRLHEENLDNVFAIAYEPQRQWTDVCGLDLLTAFYEQPRKYAFLLNLHVLNTLVERQQTISAGDKHGILERSVGSTKNIFVPYAHQCGDIDKCQLYVFQQIGRHRDEYSSDNPNTISIYLRTPPDVCFQRIKQRSHREEEASSNFNVAWLQELHQLHEDWLLPRTQLTLDGTLPTSLLIDRLLTFLSSSLKPEI